MPTVRRIQREPVQALPGVRRTQQRIAQVEAPLLRVQPPAEAFGAQLGETVAKVGEAFLGQRLSELAQEREKAIVRGNEINVMTAMTPTMEHAQAVIAQALRKQGMEAAGVPEEALTEIDKFSGEQQQRLVNDDQRFLYDREYQARRLQYHGRLMEHAAVQVAKADDDATQAKLGAITNDALLNAKNLSTVEDNIAAGESEIDKSAAARLGPVSTKAAKQDYRSDIQAKAIQMLLTQGNDRDAAKRFEEVGKQLNAADLAMVQKALEVGSTLGDSQRQSRDIWTANKGKSLTALDAEAEKIDDPKLQDAVKTRLHTYHAIYESEQADAERAFSARAKEAADLVKAQWDQFTTTIENKLDAGLPSDAMRKLPGWINAPDDVRKRLLSYADNIAVKKEGIKTDPNTYYNLYRQAASDPDAFIKRNLQAEVLFKLSPSDFQEITRLQFQMQQGKQKDVEKVLDGVRSNERIINTALTDAKIDPADKKNAEAVNHLWKAVDEEILKLQDRTGKKASNDEIQAIVDTLMISVGAQKGSWWSILPGGAPFFDVPGKRLYEMAPTAPTEPTATNPKTGEKLVFRGGQWVKP